MSPLLRASAIRLLAVGVLIGLAASSVAPAAPITATEEVLDLLQVPAAERGRMTRGEIVSYPAEEYGERELAVGLAIFVPVPVSQIAEYLGTGQLIAQDPGISSFGSIPDEADLEALGGIRFTGGERGEAEGLLHASSGSRFNLSLAEIEALRSAGAAVGTSSKSSVAEMASIEYRRLLHQRWQAYQRGGLAAVAPYARGAGPATDPAAELRLAASDAERLGRDGAEIKEALLRYPAARPAQAVNRFYWIKRQVQRRPTLSLLHQMVVLGSHLSIHVERYFYVGHSYNAAQIITGAGLHPDGAVVFTTSRLSTDDVAGVGSQMKRAVGRGQLRDEMRQRLERLRASMRQPPSIQSP